MPLAPDSTWLAVACVVALAALAKNATIRARAPRPTAGCHWRSMHALDRARARREAISDGFGPRAWLDATTPCGAALLGALYTLAWFAQGTAGEALGNLAILLTPLFFTATRLHRAPGLHATLARLTRVHAAAEARAPGAGEIVVLADGCAHSLEARWRLAWPHSLAGLEHVDLVVVEARWLDRARPLTAWLARAVEDSPADSALASVFPDATRYREGDRVAYLALALSPLDDLAHLRAWLSPDTDALLHAA